MSDHQQTPQEAEDRQRAAEFAARREPMLTLRWFAGRDEKGEAGVVMTAEGAPNMSRQVAVELLVMAANGIADGSVPWAGQ